MKDEKNEKIKTDTPEIKFCAEDKENKLKTDKIFNEIKKTPAMIEDAAELAEVKSNFNDKNHKHDSKIPVAGQDDQFENQEGNQVENVVKKEDKMTAKETDTDKKTK
jgi:hypothetical protein